MVHVSEARVNIIVATAKRGTVCKFPRLPHATGYIPSSVRLQAGTRRIATKLCPKIPQHESTNSRDLGRGGDQHGNQRPADRNMCKQVRQKASENSARIMRKVVRALPRGQRPSSAPTGNTTGEGGSTAQPAKAAKTRG